MHTGKAPQSTLKGSKANKIKDNAMKQRDS